MRSSSIEEPMFSPVLEEDDSDSEDTWQEEEFDKDGEPVTPKKKPSDEEETDDGFSMFDGWREHEEYA